jgi:hypothetical protein
MIRRGPLPVQPDLRVDPLKYQKPVAPSEAAGSDEIFTLKPRRADRAE